MIDHRNGVALVFSRTDASWCQRAMASADAMLFVAGRVEFVPGRENAHKKSRSGAGTVMFAWGEVACEGLERLQHTGVFIARQQPSSRQRSVLHGQGVARETVRRPAASSRAAGAVEAVADDLFA